MENNNSVGGFLVALGLGFVLGHWCKKEHHTTPQKPCTCKSCNPSQPTPRPNTSEEAMYYNEGVDFSTDAPPILIP
jgi:hypothetical protein